VVLIGPAVVVNKVRKKLLEDGQRRSARVE
jgi:hypothetical protein